MKSLIALSAVVAMSIVFELPTSANPPSVVPSTGIIDDSAAGWIWNGMVEYEGDSLFGGSGHAGGPGSYAAYTFNASHFRLYCSEPYSINEGGRVHKGGHIKLLVDGAPVDIKQITPSDDSVCVADIAGLSKGYHVVQVSADGGWIVVDYLQLTGSVDDNGATGQDQASQGFRAGEYRIVPRHNDTRTFGSFDGKTAITLGAESGRYGVVTLKPYPDKSYAIASTVDPALVFTMSSTKGDTGYPMVLQRHTDIPQAHWNITRDKDGYFIISNAAQPDYVFDVARDDTTIGTPVNAYLLHGLPNQQWMIIPIDPAK